MITLLKKPTDQDSNAQKEWRITRSKDGVQVTHWIRGDRMVAEMNARFTGKANGSDFVMVDGVTVWSK